MSAWASARCVTSPPTATTSRTFSRTSGEFAEGVKGNPNAAELPGLTLRENVRGTEIIPTTSTEREDFSWIADLQQVCPTCEIDAEVLDDQPPGIVAARIKLRSGNVYTWRVARYASNVTPAYFWAQYRLAVDGVEGGPPRMERPYHKMHLAARMGFTYETFCKYLELWGPPPGYAAPGIKAAKETNPYHASGP